MVRSPSVDKNGLKRGAWSEEEDNKLRAYIQRYGHWNWQKLPKFAGLARCGKSCRLRWMNYLKPGLKKGGYSREEEELIIKLQEEQGNKWSSIAAKLPGRTDNEIKNYWHTHQKKRMKQDLKSTEKTSEGFQDMHVMDQTEQASAMSISESTDEKMESDADIAAADASNEEIQSSSYNSTLSGDTENLFNSEKTLSKLLESFWKEPFFSNTSYNPMSSSTDSDSTVLGLEDRITEHGISLEESFVESFESYSAEPTFSNASNGLISIPTSCNPTVTNSEESSTDSYGSFWTEPFSLDTSYNQSIHQLPPVEEGVMLPFTPFLDYDDDLFTQF